MPGGSYQEVSLSSQLDAAKSALELGHKTTIFRLSILVALACCVAGLLMEPIQMKIINGNMETMR